MADGVCVFDIDGTLKPMGCSKKMKKHSSKQARELVQTCRNHGYEVAINTARPKIRQGMRRYLTDLGVDVEQLPKEAVQVGAITARRKVKAMHRISDAYGGVDPKRMILFDDKARNVRAALKHGYDAVEVQRSGYGCLMISEPELQRGHHHFQRRFGYAFTPQQERTCASKLA